MGLIHFLAGQNTSMYQKAGLVLRTLGWLSIAWGCITMLWLWMGLKAGSDWWLIWTIAQFVIGVIFISIATQLQARASHYMTEPETNANEIRDRAA